VPACSRGAELGAIRIYRVAAVHGRFPWPYQLLGHGVPTRYHDLSLIERSWTYSCSRVPYVCQRMRRRLGHRQSTALARQKREDGAWLPRACLTVPCLIYSRVRGTESVHGTDEREKAPPKRGQEPSENAALYHLAGPGEGSVAALSTARSISSTVMSGVILTRTTPVELPTSDMAVADTASG
jgi:hypothetical protein